MKTLRKLLNNKIGIAFAVIHWILLYFTFAKLFPSIVDSGGPESDWGVFSVFILIIDLPAIIIAAIIWSPFYIFLEDERVFWFGMFFTSLFTITFQWLFIGKSIYNMFSPSERKIISLSLTDE